MLPRLKFLGRWKWPNLLAITVLPAASFALYWRASIGPEPFGVTILGPEPIGPWVVVIGADRPLPLRSGTEVTWRVRSCSRCYAEIRKMEIALGDASQPIWPPAVLAGDPYRLAATTETPAIIPKTGLHLWLISEDLSGKRYTRSWQVAAPCR